MSDFGILALIGICGIVFLYFYLIWIFIASAVKKGVSAALYEHDKIKHHFNEPNKENSIE